MISFDELYLECIASLNSMTDEEFDLFNQQAINESRDSFMLGDLDEDEVETVVYSRTLTKNVIEHNRSTWAQGMVKSFLLTAKPTENRCMYMEEAA